MLCPVSSSYTTPCTTLPHYLPGREASSLMLMCSCLYVEPCGCNMSCVLRSAVCSRTTYTHINARQPAAVTIKEPNFTPIREKYRLGWCVCTMHSNVLREVLTPGPPAPLPFVQPGADTGNGMEFFFLCYCLSVIFGKGKKRNETKPNQTKRC